MILMESLEVIDAFTNKRLITTRNYIYVTDLKNEIFSRLPDECIIYPEIMAFSDGKDYITSKEINGLSKIFMYNLFDELKAYVDQNIDKILLDEFKQVDFLFKNLVKIYRDLKKEDVSFIINYKISKDFNIKSNYDLGFLRQKLGTKRKIKTFKNTKVFEERGYSIITSNLIFRIKYKHQDLEEIVKSFKVSDKIPIVASSLSGMRILKSLDTSLAKNWLDNKKLKGITFRVKSPYNDYYYIASISETTNKLLVRLNWKKNEYTKFEDISGIVSPGIKELFTSLSSFVEFENPKFSFSNVSYTVMQISSKFYVADSQIRGALRDFNDIFNNSFGIGEGGYMKIDYLVEKDIRIIFKKTEIIRNDGLKYDSTLIEISNISIYTDKNTLFGYLKELLLAAKERKIIKLSDKGFVEIDQVQKGTRVKEKVSIKILNEKGLDINTVSCQKKRQIAIYKNQDILPKDSYLISTKIPGISLYCKGDNEYIYPGYTSQGSPCCFLKDQRTKANFKHHRDLILKTSGVDTPNISIKNKTIIKSFKTILQSGRIGELPDFLKKVFKTDENVMRLGISPEVIKQLKYKNVVIINETSDDIFTCKERKPYEFVYPETCFVIKRETRLSGAYELIVIPGKDIQFSFDKKSPVYVSFKKTYDVSCKVSFNTLREIPYSFSQYIDSEYTILSQIKIGDKIFFLNIKELGTVPIIPSEIVEKITVTDKISPLDLETQYELFTSSGIRYLKPIGVSGNSLVIKSGLSVPVIIKNHKQSLLPEVPFGNYYPTSSKKSTDVFTETIKKIEGEEKEYTRIKYIFSKKASNIKNTFPLTTENIKQILSPEKVSESLLYKLKTELIWNKDILKGNVSLEKKNKNGYVARSDEILLITPEDIKAFFE